jgi:hypothetical protein
LRRVTAMLPLLETILSEFGQRGGAENDSHLSLGPIPFRLVD